MGEIISRQMRNQIATFLSERFGIEKFKLSLALSSKDRLWILPEDLSLIYLNDLRIEFIGIYFGSFDRDSIRLSIETCQLFGPLATKNVYELNEEQLGLWLKGADIPIENLEPGYYLLKYKNDFVGSARYANGVIKNMLQKSRRIKD